MTTSSPSPSSASAAPPPQFLRLRHLGDGLSRASSDDWWRPAGPDTARAYGGQIAAHCVVAAAHCAAAPDDDDGDGSSWECTSVQVWFLRPGTMVETEYRVTTLREGRSFGVYEVEGAEVERRVAGGGAASESERAGRRVLCKAIATFQSGEAADAAGPALLSLPRPACVPSPPSADEVRTVVPCDDRGLRAWVRLPPGQSAAGSGASWERAATLAFLSDMQFAFAAFKKVVPAADLSRLNLRGRGIGSPLVDTFSRLGGVKAASLDHAIRFHAHGRGGPSPGPGGWVLFETDAPFAGAGRAHSVGQLWSADGRLLATAAQDAVLRVDEGFARRARL